MKYFFTVVLLTWLKLGTARYAPFDSSIEARLQKLEDFMDRQKAEKIDVKMDVMAMEPRDYWTPEENVMEEGIITVTGCTAEAAAFFNQYLNSVIKELPNHITAIKLTCGKCSSLVIEGDWHASVTLCKSTKGTPCISQLTNVNCNDPHTEDDLTLPFPIPIDGTTTIATVNMILTVDKKECFFVKIPADYAKC
eukprot:Em0012g792a